MNANLKALKYLASLVAEYVENGYPLSYLVGNEAGDWPDSKEVAKLMVALLEVGCDRAAMAFVNHPDLKD